MATRIITIAIAEDNNFAVHEGELFCDRLTWDEMLGQVAMLTMPVQLQGRRALFRMTSADQMLDGNERHNARMREIFAREQEEKLGITPGRER